MSTKKQFMTLAIAEAEKAARHNEWPGGTVIVKDKEVIVKAENTVRRDNDPTAHSEINAIRKLSRQLKGQSLEGCELYTPAEPCPMCMAACIWAGISTVYFGVSLEDLVRFGDYQIQIPSNYISQKSFREIKVIGGLLEKECASLYK
ncbi:nucleoside deaminase [Patescibacteria group bacterium]|nr:nucleoside deaminase [Patescibacteria group bacterium]MBU1868572.1 nucleoside deaminase [Patescibacteria group bacterium]